MKSSLLFLALLSPLTNAWVFEGWDKKGYQGFYYKITGIGKPNSHECREVQAMGFNTAWVSSLKWDARGERGMCYLEFHKGPGCHHRLLPLYLAGEHWDLAGDVNNKFSSINVIC